MYSATGIASVKASEAVQTATWARNLPASRSLSRAGSVNNSSCVPLARSLVHMPIVAADTNTTATAGNHSHHVSRLARLFRKNRGDHIMKPADTATNSMMKT